MSAEVHEVRCSNSTLETSGSTYGLMMVLPLGRGKCPYSRVEAKEIGSGNTQVRMGFFDLLLSLFFPQVSICYSAKDWITTWKKKKKPTQSYDASVVLSGSGSSFGEQVASAPIIGIYRNCIRWRGFSCSSSEPEHHFQEQHKHFFLVEVQSALVHNCWGAIF